MAIYPHHERQSMLFAISGRQEKRAPQLSPYTVGIFDQLSIPQLIGIELRVEFTELTLHIAYGIKGPYVLRTLVICPYIDDIPGCFIDLKRPRRPRAFVENQPGLSRVEID